MNENLRQEFDDIMVKEITREMDNQILADMLVNAGWHLIEMPGNTVDDFEVRIWCTVNATGEWKILWPRILFSDEKDAMLCKLKWI